MENIENSIEDEIERVLKKAGHEFHNFRIRKRLSVIAVARAAGISETTINNIENGRKQFHIDILQKLCIATGFPFQLFLHPLLRWEESCEPELHDIVSTLHEMPIQFRPVFFQIVLAILAGFSILKGTVRILK